MQNKLSSIGAELEKDRCKSVEIRQLTDTEKFTSHTPDNPRHSFLRRLPAYAARSGNFETFLEIFSTLFCKNWRESPWKHGISEKQECHAGEEISNSCFFKDGDEKF